MDSCPKELEAYDIAHKKKLTEQDVLMHAWWGNYGLSAVAVAIDHCLNGEKAKSKYIEKTIFHDLDKEENSYKESKEEVAVFEMKQRINLLRQTGLPESPI